MASQADGKSGRWQIRAVASQPECTLPVQPYMAPAKTCNCRTATLIKANVAVWLKPHRMETLLRIHVQ